jgi:hypothetical protein
MNRLRQRHLFHWKHRSVFALLDLGAGCVGVWIILSFMPAGARERNSLLALVGAVYFSCVHTHRRFHPFFRKEIAVALLFTVGCALPTFGRAAETSGSFVATIAFFVTIAWLNCHAIEFWESGQTMANPQVFSASWMIAVTGFIAAAVLHSTHFGEADLMATGAASALLLAFLDRMRGRMTPLALRVTADLVLLTPLMLAF